MVTRPRLDLEFTRFYAQVSRVFIESGSAVSDTLDLDGTVPLALETPASFAGSVVTFLASVDNTVFVPVFDDAGNEYTVSVGPSRWVPIRSDLLRGARWIQLRTGTASAPVNQTSTVAFLVVSGVL